jgi:hypothetical protein
MRSDHTRAQARVLAEVVHDFESWDEVIDAIEAYREAIEEPLHRQITRLKADRDWWAEEARRHGGGLKG